MYVLALFSAEARPALPRLCSLYLELSRKPLQRRGMLHVYKLLLLLLLLLRVHVCIICSFVGWRIGSGAECMYGEIGEVNPMD